MPGGRLGRGEGLLAGQAMSLCGLGVLAAGVSFGAAAVSALTIVTYLLFYTPLKPVTPWSTVVGAFPGALPPLLGWCAAASMRDGGAWAGLGEAGGWSLVALLFVWQVPHVMAISWKYRGEYEAGGYRVLPSVDPSGAKTSLAAVAWSLALVPISLVPVMVMPAGVLGVGYMAVAIMGGVAFVGAAVAMSVRRTASSATAMFVVTIVYLPVVLLAMVGDALSTGLLG